MDRSPQGRWIERVEGSPDPIRSRGTSITELGDAMGSSAAFLKTLADQASGQKGQAIEKLQEVVGDTHEQLSLAGKLYRPTGPVLVAYADALADVQPRLNAAADRCGEAWSAYVSADGYLPGDRPSWGQPEAGTPEAKTNGEHDLEKKRKHDDFVAEAQIFDAAYDTWETAFDTAVHGITEATSGTIKDGFWDDVDGFVAGTLKVLQVVGIIVGIAAIIIGGPIFALIGGVIGLITLGLTIYQYVRGDTGLTQLILAVVGVIPFGSVGKLFQGSAGRLAFLGDTFMALKPSSWSAAVGQGRTLSLIGSMAGGGWRGAASMGRGLFTMNNPAGVGDVMMRLMFGKDVGGMSQTIEAMTGAANGYCLSTTLPAALQFAHNLVSGPWKLGDKIASWTGHDGPSKSLPWVGAVL